MLYHAPQSIFASFASYQDSLLGGTHMFSPCCWCQWYSTASLPRLTQSVWATQQHGFKSTTGNAGSILRAKHPLDPSNSWHQGSVRLRSSGVGNITTQRQSSWEWSRRRIHVLSVMKRKLPSRRWCYCRFHLPPSDGALLQNNGLNTGWLINLLRNKQALALDFAHLSLCWRPIKGMLNLENYR